MKKVNQKSFSLRLAFLVACAMIIILIVNVNMKINSIKQTSLELDRQIAQVDRQIERLKAEFEKPLTDQAMRQFARDTLGFYLSDEIIYQVA